VSDLSASKIQKIVDLLKDSQSQATAPPAPTHGPTPPDLRHLVQINMQPGAIVQQFHTHYHAAPGEVAS